MTMNGIRVGLLLAAAMVCLSACRDDRLVETKGLLVIRPSSLSFKKYEGASEEKTFEVANDGRATLELQWEDPTGLNPEAPGPSRVFTLLDPLPATLSPGQARIRVRFDAHAEPGDYEVRVVARAGGEEKSLLLKGTILEIPECNQPEPCQTFHFDTTLEQCVPTNNTDGSACAIENKCLVQSQCTGGVCVGLPKPCDDGNACTTDVCDSQVGCMTFPAPPCPGDGKCQVGACDPVGGCFMTPAPDGTSCGSNTSCIAADICIEGSCLVRDPPDGAICREASPCQRKGGCQNDICVVDPKEPIAANFSFDSRTQGQGGEYHDLVIHTGGELSLFGTFWPPLLDVTNSETFAEGRARRCMIWNGRSLCLDYGLQDGNIALLNSITGQPIWSFNLTVARPDLAKDRRLFLGRAAIAGTDRFAALFESYPPGSANNTNCREYFLMVLNASGQLVSAHRIQDPLLDERDETLCNHPHPFGMGADVAGNFFIAFSPSVKTSGALIPSAPTLMMAFARDGTPRWKRRLDIQGGELAVARGLLFPERGSTPLRSSDGEVLGSQSVAFGRPGVTVEHVISAPRVGTNSLESRPLELAPPWTYQLPNGMVWATDQLRLATYKPRPESEPEQIVLSFTQPSVDSVQLPGLVGIRARDGVEQFFCPVDYAATPIGSEGSPQMFEVGPQSMALMDGTPACGRCDPPYAGIMLGGPESHGRFFRFSTPTLSPATAPWPGAFGGEGHDHQENSTFNVLPPQQ